MIATTMKNAVFSFAAASLLIAGLAGCTYFREGQKMSEKEASVIVKPFGKTKDGQLVHLYTLTGAGGVVMDVIDYGGRIVRLQAPDRQGKLEDITLGFNTINEYEAFPGPYFGALIGRYGNRIAKGQFTLDGQTYTLPTNNAPASIPCSLHGGTQGFDARVWHVEPLTEGETVGLKLSMTSPDGDQGYPGTLKVDVTYWLTSKNVWKIEYEATTDKATPINLTQHLYFNLKGQAEGDILDHELTLFADKLTPVDKGLIPTGKITSVIGTPFDFTTPHLIGERINAKDEQLDFGYGYDHNWVLNNPKGKLVKAATLSEKTTGRLVEVWTTEPAIQFYSGNFLNDEVPSKTPGKKLCRRGGLALETQHSPDSPNQPNFPSTILRPGALYKTTTEYRFGVK